MAKQNSNRLLVPAFFVVVGFVVGYAFFSPQNVQITGLAIGDLCSDDSECGAGEVCSAGVCSSVDPCLENPESCAPPAYCGNAMCDADEDCLSCETDCGPCGPPPCNDCSCDASLCEPDPCLENPESCAPPDSMCGNANCDAGEDSSNCPADCPIIEVAQIPEPDPNLPPTAGAVVYDIRSGQGVLGTILLICLATLVVSILIFYNQNKIHNEMRRKR